MKWTIDKSFDLCYGHRVWSQTLDREYSLNTCLECRHLHGHQGRVTVFLEASNLNMGMVTDFKHLEWFKLWLDSVVDHKFIIDRNDPLFFDLMSHYCDKNGDMDQSGFTYHEGGYWTPRLELLPKTDDALREKYEGMVVVDFVPTSEMLAAWFFGVVEKKMQKLNIEVKAIEFWETPKSHCRVEK